MSMDIIAQPQSMTMDPEGTEVQVEVAGPRVVPEGAKRLRARARALIASGVLPTGRDNIEDITAGEVQRLTKIKGEPVVEEAGTIMEAKLYTVIVSREQN